MAKILSHVWSTARGSVGGITYTTNSHGQIIARQRTAPVQPNTTLQQQLKQSFSQAQSLWRALSTAARQGWRDYAAGCQFEGPQGNYTIPGREMFLRNIGTALYLQARTVYTVAVNTSPPLDPGLPALGPYYAQPLSAPGTGFELVGINLDPYTALYYGFVSRAFDDTRLRFKGPFQGSTLQAVSAVSGAGYILPFTGLTDGSTYFVVLARITMDAAGTVLLSVKDYLRTVASETIV